MNYTSLFIETNLPRKLSNLETYEYFNKYKTGDLLAREQLIIHNIRLVIYQVNKFNNLFDKQELVSVGIIGLINAIDTFDIEKGYEFSTYASTCIDNEILSFIKKEKKHSKNDSLEKVISANSSGYELKLEDTLSDKNCEFTTIQENNETFLAIRNLINELTDIEKLIIMYYLGFIDNNPLSQQEISKKLNISRPKISITIARILLNIKEKLQEDELIEFYKRKRRKNH